MHTFVNSATGFMLTILIWLVISCWQCLRFICKHVFAFFFGGGDNILFLNTNNVVVYCITCTTVSSLVDHFTMISSLSGEIIILPCWNNSFFCIIDISALNHYFWKDVVLKLQRCVHTNYISRASALWKCVCTIRCSYETSF